MTDLKRLPRSALARLDAGVNRVFGAERNPLYHSGAIAVTLLTIVIATGLYLLLFYRLATPWSSVSRISEQVWAGRWIRSLHRFASDAAVVAIAVHVWRMFVQGRSWGPRALAWTTGVLLLSVVFICGWTGYVMVWDTHAQLLAQEGARFLDVLPIFSEPISRTFVGERPLPYAFFFLNLFAHIALPVGLGLLLWIHVARVARPVVFPRRGVAWGVAGLLLVLSVVWPVAMLPEADLFRQPQAPLDLFFTFWLPFTVERAAWQVWLVGSLVGSAVVLVPLWSRPRAKLRPAKSHVDERLCTGCEQCVQDCPYNAIRMVERTDGRSGLVALVNPDLCVACGICTGSCAPMGVGPVSRTGRDQLAEVRAFLRDARPGAGDVVVIGCSFSAAGDPATTRDVLTFPVQCAGNLHTSTIEFLLRGGAGGVLICTCQPRDCRGREGVKWLEQRMNAGREAELQARVDRTRVRVVYASSAERSGLRDALDDFRSEISAREAAAAEADIDLLTLCKEAPQPERVEEVSV